MRLIYLADSSGIIDDEESSIVVRRIALLRSDLDGLPSFDVETKRGDARFDWYKRTTGSSRAWELDAMPPPVLRDRLETAITAYIDKDAWHRTGLAEQAEQDSLKLVMGRWTAGLKQIRTSPRLP